jgi:hypothetical protein
MSISYRAFVFTAAMTAASAALAQQPADAPPQPDPAKPQVRTFEMVLRNAIETAGQNLARRARQIAPSMADMTFAFAPGQAPVVNGIADHEMGLYVFQVQVPNISLSLQVINLWPCQRRWSRHGGSDGDRAGRPPRA